MIWTGMRRRSAELLNIGWFSTGRGEGSRGLLRFVQDRIDSGKLEARIQFVFSNRSEGESQGSDQFFDLVNSYDLPLITLSSTQFRKSRGGRFAQYREEYDRLSLNLLPDYRPDVCVLAGYMLILSSAMCRQFHFLNLHPALPDGPIGTWQEVIWELIETRASRTGAMIHLATEEVDRGPVVSYCTVPIDGEEFGDYWRDASQNNLTGIKADQGEDYGLFKLIREVEYQREPYLLFETLRAVAGGEVIPGLANLLDAKREPLNVAAPHGLCLDAAIDREMAEDGLIRVHQKISEN